MTAHRPYVYRRTDCLDGTVWAACCPCGWESPDSDNEQVARARLAAHRRENG